MKKIFLLVMSLTLVFAMAGCGDKNEKTSGPVYDDSLIEEMFSEDGQCVISDKESYDYSYHVPSLKSDSEDAVKINDDIKERVGEIAELEFAAAERKEFYQRYSSISWKAYWHDSIVSLVIECGQPVAPNDFFVYNFDFESGKSTDRAAMLEEAGLTEEEFDYLAKGAAVKEYDGIHIEQSAEPEALDMYYSVSLPMRAETLADALSDENPLALDGDKLMFVTEIKTPAGAGWYSKMLEIEKPSDMKKTVTDSFVTADLENGKVSLKFEKTEDAEIYLSGDHPTGQKKAVEYGKKYEIDGLYRNYKDMFIGVMGQDYFPYLILTTDEGTLEFVNILECARYGKFAALPVPGIKDVNKLSADVVEEKDESGNLIGAYNTVFAETEDGDKYDLAEWATVAERSSFDGTKDGTLVSDSITHKLDSGGSYDSIYFVNFNKDGDLDFDDVLPDADITTHYDGYHTLLGMTDKGLVYGYAISADMDFYKGALEVRHAVAKGGGRVLYDQIMMRNISGQDIFDRAGKWTKFHLAAG